MTHCTPHNQQDTVLLKSILNLNLLKTKKGGTISTTNNTLNKIPFLIMYIHQINY